MRAIYILMPCLGLLAVSALIYFSADSDAAMADILAIYSPPSSDHFLGTDMLGRDLLVFLAGGVINSFFIAVAASFLTLLFGLAYLFLARVFGYYFFMRVLDLLLALPSLILIMFFQSIFAGGAASIIFLVAITHFAAVARVLDSQIRRLQSCDFYIASVGLGMGESRAFFSELLPGLWWLMAVLFVLNIVHAIAMEATLGFFGLGLGMEVASLGNVLNEAGRGLFLGVWWVAGFGVVAILLLVGPLLGVISFWQERFSIKI